MSKGQARDRRKEQHWRQLIQQWRSSGLTVRAFCARHHLAEPSFYAWRRELQQRDADQVAFVPVRVLDPEAPAAAAGIDLLLPGQRTVRVAPGFDSATLRRLLAVLEQASC
jgi:transposase-like protein